MRVVQSFRDVSLLAFNELIELLRAGLIMW